MGAQQAERRRAVEAALLDFYRAPGRHTLALREPALLFASIRDVLQLAADRDDAQTPADVARAARFFVRTAMLQPGADHYALLGVPRHAEASAIKDRYRALMRLVHPDFATPAGADWPADTATRINQAYEVLSSADRRRAYDEAQAPPAAPKPTAQAARDAAPAKAPAPPARGIGEPRRVLRRLAVGFGTLGGLALIGLWSATAQNDLDSLVQRATTRAATLSKVSAPTAAVVASPANADAGVTHTAASIPAAIPASLPASAAVPVVLASALPELADTPAPSLQMAPVMQVAQATPAPTSASEPARAPSLTLSSPTAQPSSLNMAIVQPLLTRLLQNIESGWGDSLIAGLDRSLRSTAGAQALARQIDALCDGVRPVKIARIDLRGEPQGGNFVVTGQVVLEVRDSAAPTRQLAVQAEFIERDGAPVLARVGPAS